MSATRGAPQLSVITVNYGTAAHLRNCLHALVRSTLQPEIIVVDNDGSAAPLAREFPRLVYLPQARNRYFCAGNNIGLRAAQGKYALLLNPDTAPQPTALEQMVAFMEANPQYRGATMQLRHPDGRIQQTCSRIPTWRYLLLRHSLPGPWLQRLEARHRYAGWARNCGRDVMLLPGSCLLMRREELWLDEDLLLYFPEDALAARFAGARFRFLADSYITHHERSVTISQEATRIFWRDLLVYTRKQHGRARAALLWLLSRPLYLALMLRWQIRRAAPSRLAGAPR